MNIRLTISNLYARAAMLLLAIVISIGAWAEEDNKFTITGVKSQLLREGTYYTFEYNLTWPYEAELIEGENYIVTIKDKEGKEVTSSDVIKREGNVVTVYMSAYNTVACYTLTISCRDDYYSVSDTDAHFCVLRVSTDNSFFTITNKDKLNKMAEAVNWGMTFAGEQFKLDKDLTFDNTDNIYEWDEENKEYIIYNFIPIGGKHNGVVRDFCGTFDGGGHTISGINIHNKIGYGGIFGRLGSGAVVKNLTLDKTTITCPSTTGGIAGINYGGKITNCHVTNNVIIKTDDENSSYHGGIAGQNGGNDVNGEISYCTSAAQLTIKSGITSWDFYGGIVGLNRSGSTLDHNLVIGAVLPIPTTTDEKCGAITGSNDPGNDSGNTSGILKYNYYDDCTLGIIGIGDNSSDVTNQAEPATILTDTKGLSLPTSLSGKVVYFRAFRYGEPSTIILPFVPNRTENVDKFYTFKGVEKDGNYYKAIMEESTSLNYNTPYIYKAVKPNNETENFRLYFDCYDLESSASDVQEAGSTKPAEDTHWTFKGSYSEILWEALPSGQKRNVYGFAGQAVSDTEDSSKSIEAGEFVRIGEYVRLRPQRCYMEYTPTSSTRAGSLTDEELPETIRVILVDDGGKTDIGSLSTKTGIITFDSDAWYSLNGKRFSTQPNQKGIYVNNGKKVVIK